MLQLRKMPFLILLMLMFQSVALAGDGFELIDISGKAHHLNQYRGKWVVVNYWATWCPPCLEEVPELVSLYDDRKDQDVMVIGVVFDYEHIDEVTRYVDDMLMSYPIVLGDASITKQIGSAEALPTTYVYNPVGQLIKIKRGLVTRQYLETLMVDEK